MPKLRNTVTGVVVEVPEELVDRLGAGYEPVDKPAPKRGASKKQ